MSEESIDILLSARDEASAVFRKTSGELELLRNRIEQVGNSTKKGTDAIGKLARAAGLGEFASAANQVKDLAGSIADVGEAARASGVGALALRAGLVGIVGYLSYKGGSFIADMIYDTKGANAELEKSVEILKRMTTQQEKLLAARLASSRADLKEFGGDYQTQAKKAEAMIAKLSSDAQAVRDQITHYEKIKKEAAGWIDDDEDTIARSDTEIEGAKKRLEIIEQEKQALEDSYSIAEQNREQVRRDREELKAHDAKMRAENDRADEAEKKQRDAIKEKTSSISQQILQMKMTNDEYELYELRLTTTNDKELKKLESLVKQKQELERQKKEQEEIERIQERQLGAQIKGAEKNVGDIKNRIGELQNFKIDVSRTSLNSKDERITSLSRDSRTSIAQQQLAQTKKHVEIAELQRLLMVEIENHNKLIANKKDPIVSLF